MVHAGLVPQWSVAQTLRAGARGRAARCAHDPRGAVRAHVRRRAGPLGRGAARARSGCASPSTCSRACACARADGRVDLKMKGAPPPPPSPLRPGSHTPSAPSRDARVIFGHWSALGFVQRPGVIGAGHRLRVGRCAHRVSIWIASARHSRPLRAAPAHQRGVSRRPAAPGPRGWLAAAPQRHRELRRLGACRPPGRAPGQSAPSRWR